jgi:hypothetical protein
MSDSYHYERTRPNLYEETEAVTRVPKYCHELRDVDRRSNTFFSRENRSVVCNFTQRFFRLVIEYAYVSGVIRLYC